MSEPLFTPDRDRESPMSNEVSQKTHLVQARQQGYSGQRCWRCRSYRLRPAGSCALCEDCGETSGGCG